jgi:hypothetical protein
MEAFEIAYDDETKQWIRRPCEKPREVAVPRRFRVTGCVLAVVTLQAVAGLWLLSRWRS